MKRFVLLFFLFTVSFFTAHSQQYSYYVTNSADSGPGSLRQAITDANAGINGTTIYFNIPVQTYTSNPIRITLFSPLPILQKNIHIVAANFIGSPYYNTSPIEIYGGGFLKTPGIFGGSGVCDIPIFTGFVATSFYVTNTNDAGSGSLRDAINLAYIIKHSSGKDTIKFNISGTPPHKIQFITALQDLVMPMVLDGSTQPANGYSGTAPKIELDGNGFAINAAFTLNYDGTYNFGNKIEIYGFHIHDFKTGIALKSASSYIDNIIIGAPGKGNVISNNLNDGISGSNFNYDYSYWDYANNITIQNNFIGTTVDGLAANGNGSNGINILLGTNTKILNNVISGNVRYGISNSSYNGGGCSSGIIKGNKIGTDPAGSYAIANQLGGIFLRFAYSMTIGGSNLSDRNIISGNNGPAISNTTPGWGGVYTNNFVIKNNYIGVDSSGTIPLPNNGNGVYLQYDGWNHIIGGSGPFEKNIIANNKGMAIQAKARISRNIIYNNNKSVDGGVSTKTVITQRSNDSISGTCSTNNYAQIQLYYDNDYNAYPQGKDYIGKVYAGTTGKWVYKGYIADPCHVTAIMVDTVLNYSSGFSDANNFTLGPDKIACIGDSVILDAGIGFSTYTWSTGETSQKIKVASNGDYWVSVYNGCTHSDTINVSFISPPSVNLGKDSSVCASQIVTLDAGTHAGATYQWSTGATTQTYPAQLFLSKYTTHTSTYWVDVNAGGSCVRRDSINITFKAIPSPVLPLTVVACTGASVNLDAGNAGCKYLWSTGDSIQSINTASAGKFWVNITNSNNCSRTDTTNVSYTAPPVVNLGKDTLLCNASSLILNAKNPGAYKIVWSTNYVNFQTITVNSSGIYWVDVYSGNSCKTRDSIKVILNPSFSVNLGPDATYCNGTSVLLDAGNPAALHYWSTGDTTRKISVTNSGKYWVDVTYGLCTKTDTININFVSPPIVNLGKDTLLCSASITLKANNPGATYIWYTNNSYTSSASTLYVSTSGAYSLFVYTGSNCYRSDTINVSIKTKPSVNLGPDIKQCSISTQTLNSGNAGYKHLWSRGDTTQSIAVNTSGKYWAMVNNGGCKASDTVLVVMVANPTLNLGKDTIACGPIVLDAGNPGANYSWSPPYGLSTQKATITSSGNYMVTVTYNSSCVLRDTITVLIPHVNLGKDTVVCSGTSYLLNAYNMKSPQYLWSNGSTNYYTYVSQPGTYSVEVSYAGSTCKARDTVKVGFKDCGTISGTVYNDINSNCIQDAGETGISEKFIMVTNTTLTFWAYTDNNGHYNIIIPAGNYKVSLHPDNKLNMVCPSSGFYNTTVSNNATSTINFSVHQIPNQDLEIYVSNPGLVRPGSTFTYFITYKNSGTLSMSGTLDFTYDTILNYISSSIAPVSKVGRTLNWSFSNLLPGQSGYIQVQVSVPFNSSYVGIIFCSVADIFPVAGDFIPYNNSANSCSKIGYPYDPNYKAVFPEGDGPSGNITKDDSVLTYTIHFQNTGSASAQKVVVTDTLSKFVNLTTVQPLGSSHNYKFDVTREGVLKWTFDNINLPDSASDLEKSQGFLTYSIHLIKNAPFSTEIRNNADIYFDANPAVITDTAINTLVPCIAPLISVWASKDSICPGSNVSFNVVASKGKVPYLFNWTSTQNLFNANNNNPNSTPDTTASYIVSVKENNGCITYDTLIVVVRDMPSAESGINDTICRGDTLQIGMMPLAFGAGSPFIYNWTPAGNINNAAISNPDIFPDSSTVYRLIVSDKFGCTSTDSVNITVSTPKSDAGLETTICGNGIIQIGSQALSGYTYSWNPSVGLNDSSLSNPLLSADSTEIYYLTAIDKYGCAALDSIKIIVNSIPLISASNDTMICNSGGNVVLTLNANGNAATYLWMPTGDQTQSITVNPNATTTYVVKAISVEGCTAFDSVKVVIDNCTGTRSGLTNNFIKVYPNPFLDYTTINYSLYENSNVTIEIFTLLGVKLTNLVSGYFLAGEYTQQLTCPKQGSFLLRLTIGDRFYYQTLVQE